MKKRVFSGTLKFDVFSEFSKNGHHTECSQGDTNGAKMGSFLRLKNQLVYQVLVSGGKIQLLQKLS